MRALYPILLVLTQLVVSQQVEAQDTTRLPARVITADADRRATYNAKTTRSATKTDSPLINIPQSVSLVTKALIADQSMQGMADVVRYVPGITMGQGEGHRDAPTIRGQSSSADFFIDGMRDDAQYLRDLYNVERVEALKGSNAMIFGRGGGGGVINRVMKEPSWSRTMRVSAEGGSFDHKRSTLDLGAPLSSRAAARFNAIYERSGGFRDGARKDSEGLNPEVALALGPNTVARVGYEHFSDERNVDRGIPSFQGRPVGGDVTRFFGNPQASFSRARLDGGHVTVSHGTFRSATRYVAYDKFYQNVYAAGAVNTAGTHVNLSGYDAATARANLYNQSDVSFRLGRHSLLMGAELGRSGTTNVRNTGFFNNVASTTQVTVDQPTSTTPVTFRPVASDANSYAVATVAAAFVQDQVSLGSHWLAVAGVRVDRFSMDFHNNRTDAVTADLARVDRVLSPRVGLIFKPVERLSLYATHSEAHLPSSGDQFSSLTVTTQTLEPEVFVNRELGFKWELGPTLSFTAAAYRLDRSRSIATDPSDASRMLQTGAVRTSGVELGLTGDVTSSWQIAAGLTAQRSRTSSATTTAKLGSTTPLVPERTASLWNKLRVTSKIAMGLGLIRQSDTFAALDNTVQLPAFTRADAALYFELSSRLRGQVNIENVADTRYYWTSHGNNNIMPGAPRTLRLSLIAGN